VEALHNEQANADFSVLCELLKDYIALIGAIKVVHAKRSFERCSIDENELAYEY
jgi:sorting nexin-1/2